MTTTVLRVDASMRRAGSVTRALADRAVDRLRAADPDLRMLRHDLAETAPAFVSEDWIGANFTADEERSAAQRRTLAGSDALIADLKAADTLIIAAPIYNFGVPAALKAWIDQIARARVTFAYTENGPVGLLEGKKAIVIVASGGTEADAAIDFTTPYLRHVLGFIGIHDVEFIAADRLMLDPARRAAAESRIDALAA